MQNEWLKEKVREELEIEYKQKLDEIVAFYEKKLLDCCEEAYQILQAERAKSSELEVKIYQEYDKKCAELRSYLVDAVTRYLKSPHYKHGMIAEQIIDEALKA